MDKNKAINGRRRISEDCLIYISLVGGCFGMSIAMCMFHHKTRKLKFKLVYLFVFIWIFVLFKIILKLF